MGGADKIDHEEMAKALTKALNRDSVQRRFLAGYIHPEGKKFENVLRDWFHAGIVKIREVNRIFNEAADCHAIPRPGAPWDPKFDMRSPQRQDPKGDKGKESKDSNLATKRGREKDSESKDKGGDQGKGEGTPDGEACYGCGRHGHKADKCIYLHPEQPHPNANTEKVPWADSTMGKKWLEGRGKPVLPGRETIDKKPWQSLRVNVIPWEGNVTSDGDPWGVFVDRRHGV